MKTTLINTKKINDPLFPSVDLFLKELITKAYKTKDEVIIKESLRKYSDLAPEDLLIEDPIETNEGLKLCFLTRKTGFCRGDAKINKVDFKTIIETFGVKYYTRETTNKLKEPTLFIVNDDVYIKTDHDRDVDDYYKLFNKIFFDKYELELYKRVIDDKIGTLTLENKNMDPITIPLYTYRPELNLFLDKDTLSGFSL